jgi:excisionase family DNA binding protein
MERPTTPLLLDDLPELLTIEELRRVLRIGRSFAHELIATGRVPHLRIGRRVRVPRAAVRALLEEWRKHDNGGAVA